MERMTHHTGPIDADKMLTISFPFVPVQSTVSLFFIPHDPQDLYPGPLILWLDADPRIPPSAPCRPSFAIGLERGHQGQSKATTRDPKKKEIHTQKSHGKKAYTSAV